MYIHTCVTTITEKEAMKLRMSKGVPGRVWREEREGGNCVILL